MIDLLANGRRFAVLRRETNLEAAMIDGALTANLQPDGLQVGDILDFAVTLTQHEPALAGHSEGGAFTAHAGTVARLLVSIAWPAASSFRTWKTDDLPALVKTSRAGWTQVGFDQTDSVSPEPPKGAPVYDRLFGLIQASNFKTWNEVSATAFPLYAKAATLQPNSPLQAEMAAIRAASSDPKARALAALKLVESQTRYFYVGLNAGGFIPATADVTWGRRFGDCKGKTVLLLALLKGLGVSAEAALVNTVLGDGLGRRLPQLSAFDHVLVRTEIDGKVYWLDATRMGDENLDVIPVPNYGWALPVRAQGASLEPLSPDEPLLPLGEVIVNVDARGGIDKPARVHEEMVLHGDAALGFDLAMKQASRLDADRILRKGLTAQRPWINPDKVNFSYDAQKMQARMTLDGSGKPPFTSADGVGSVKDWTIEGASVGYVADLTRTSDYHRDAPFAVVYPSYSRVLIEVQLPNGGKGFEVMNGESVSRVVAGIDYARTAAITDGKFVLSASQRAVARNFPAADAASTAAGLRSLAEYDVSVRFNEPTSTASTTPEAKRAEPSKEVAQTTTDLDKHNNEAAEADFTKALATQTSAKLYYNRAVARAALGKEALAQADLREALRLDPKHAYASFALGRYAIRRGDTGAAARHFAAAEQNSVKPLAMDVRIAGAYEEERRYTESYIYWDRVSAAVSDPQVRALALNSSCWVRAEGGIDLSRALGACNAALSLKPGSAEILDSRALVELRTGATAKALNDYDAALAARPNIAVSLYGRGLAKARLGKAEEAKIDIDMAVSTDPTIGNTFARWGVSR